MFVAVTHNYTALFALIYNLIVGFLGRPYIDDSVALIHNNETCHPVLYRITHECGYPHNDFWRCPGISIMVAGIIVSAVTTITSIILARVIVKRPPDLVRVSEYTMVYTLNTLFLLEVVFVCFEVFGVFHPPVQKPLHWACNGVNTWEEIPGWNAMISPDELQHMYETCGGCNPSSTNTLEVKIISHLFMVGFMSLGVCIGVYNSLLSNFYEYTR